MEVIETESDQSKESKRCCNFILTVFADPIAVGNRCAEIKAKSNVRYVAWGNEKCPTTGRLHSHVIVVCKRDIAFKVVKAFFYPLSCFIF